MGWLVPSSLQWCINRVVHSTANSILGSPCIQESFKPRLHLQVSIGKRHSSLRSKFWKISGDKKKWSYRTVTSAVLPDLLNWPSLIHEDMWQMGWGKFIPTKWWPCLCCNPFLFLALAQLLTWWKGFWHFSPNLVFEIISYSTFIVRRYLAIPRHLSGVLAVGLRLRALLSWPVTGSAFRRQGAHTENQDPYNDDATPRAFTPHLQNAFTYLQSRFSHPVSFTNSYISSLISREFVSLLRDAWWKGMSL